MRMRKATPPRSSTGSVTALAGPTHAATASSVDGVLYTCVRTQVKGVRHTRGKDPCRAWV